MEDIEAVGRVLDRINSAWATGHPTDIGPLVHQNVVMVFPGFGGVSRGREAFVASFVDFCTNARVITAKERGRQINITGSTAVASFEFEIDNERGGERVRSTGRDLWVLAKEEAPWVAVWRTMLDVRETGT